jgi:hypothetical protein
MQKLIFAQLVKKFAPFLTDTRGLIAVRFAVVTVYGFPGRLGEWGWKYQENGETYRVRSFMRVLRLLENSSLWASIF